MVCDRLVYRSSSARPFLDSGVEAIVPMHSLRLCHTNTGVVTAGASCGVTVFGPLGPLGPLAFLGNALR